MKNLNGEIVSVLILWTYALAEQHHPVDLDFPMNLLPVIATICLIIDVVGWLLDFILKKAKKI